MNCDVCKKEINENSNFCSNCGNPITDIAKKIEITKKKTIELKLLSKLMEEINDDSSLNIITRYVEKR